MNVDQFGHRLEAPNRLPLSTPDRPTWVVRPFDVSGHLVGAGQRPEQYGTNGSYVTLSPAVGVGVDRDIDDTVDVAVCEHLPHCDPRTRADVDRLTARYWVEQGCPGET